MICANLQNYWEQPPHSIWPGTLVDSSDPRRILVLLQALASFNNVTAGNQTAGSQTANSSRPGKQVLLINDIDAVLSSLDEHTGPGFGQNLIEQILRTGDVSRLICVIGGSTRLLHSRLAASTGPRILLSPRDNNAVAAAGFPLLGTWPAPAGRAIVHTSKGFQAAQLVGADLPLAPPAPPIPTHHHQGISRQLTPKSQIQPLQKIVLWQNYCQVPAPQLPHIFLGLGEPHCQPVTAKRNQNWIIVANSFTQARNSWELIDSHFDGTTKLSLTKLPNSLWQTSGHAPLPTDMSPSYPILTWVTPQQLATSFSGPLNQLREQSALLICSPSRATISALGWPNRFTWWETPGKQHPQRVLYIQTDTAIMLQQPALT